MSMKEPTAEQLKMLRSYEADMFTSPPPLPDELAGEWCRKVAKKILDREGIPHFLCRRCWHEKKRTETIIQWPGICDECGFEMKWR